MTKKVNALILAAGYGNRLGTKYNFLPKCLLRIGKTSLIKRIILNLIKLNFEEVTIATGYKSKSIQEELKDCQKKIKINYIHNKKYRSSGHGYTIYKCIEKDLGKKDLIIIHGDLFFDLSIFIMCHSKIDRNLLLVDEKFKINTFDEMIITTKNKKVKSIEKYHRNIRNIKGEIVGINFWNKKFLYQYINFSKLLFKKEGIQFNWEQILNRMLLNDEKLIINYKDIGNKEWININYPKDYSYAKKIYKSLKE